PIATTLSLGCTIDEPAALVTRSTHPIGGWLVLEIVKVRDPLSGAVAPVESVAVAVTVWVPRLRPLILSSSDQPVFANAGLTKYAATSGRGVDALAFPATLPSTETVTCTGVAPSSQSAAQPIATTLSVGRTTDDPAALLTLSTHPIG